MDLVTALSLGSLALLSPITGVVPTPTPTVVTRQVMVERQVVARPVTVYQVPGPVYYRTYVEYAPVRRAWCPPGLAKQGRCEEHWRRHHK